MIETNCAACGGPIVVPTGTTKEFCSRSCYRAGRSHCKHCNKPLTRRSARAKRDFCDEICRSRYKGLIKAAISPSLSEERKRLVCKGCGRDMAPAGTVKFFCSQRCGSAYRRTLKHGLDLYSKWGMYGPLTRGMIREVEDFMGVGAAKRLAVAIDREYILRSTRANPQKREAYIVTCTCKTCGKDFGRRSWSTKSKEYCSRKCMPWMKDESVLAKLTWEEVDEIRNLYAHGIVSYRALGEKFGVNRTEISRIVRCEIWKPERDPRRTEVSV